MQLVNAFGRLIIDICLLRKGPEDIPYSLGLFAAALFVSTAIGYPTLTALPAGTPTPGLDLALTVGFSLAFIQLLLRGYGVGARFLQTVTALFAVDALISALTLASLRLGGPDSEGAMLLLSTLVIWNIAIIAHILRRALGAGLVTGLAWTFGYIIGSGLMLEVVHS